MDLNKSLNDLCAAFDDIKREVYRRDPSLYEQWKAGGFLVDENVVSMYPNVSDVVERLAGEEEDEGEDDVDEEDEE